MAPTHSATANRVVVALLDGRRLKGYVFNFSTDAVDFNVFPDPKGDEKKSPATLVEFKACKAIFFVRTHEGSKEGRDAERKAAEDPARRPPRGTKIKIIFSDGEEMMACTEVYAPQKKGFFAYPMDARSNNLRIYIVNVNVRQVLTGSGLSGSTAAGPDQARLARLSKSAPPPTHVPGKPAAGEAVPLDLKCEAALRVLNGDAPAELEQEYGIPAAVISYWTRVFLQAGRHSLSAEPAAGDLATETLLAELRRRIRDLEAEIEHKKSLPEAPAPRRKR